ncbi:PHF7 protein, partial [Chunga burmeisteri]|nr:PHF7 protein [Chunga burmeisteri]
CGLCQRADCDPEVVGPLCHQNRLWVHENCLHHTSKLNQRGANNQGFYGFFFCDIWQEFKRAAQKVRPGGTCPHREMLHLPGTSVICCHRHCPQIFHFPCGKEQGCVSQFFGEYKSFCWKHRPVQRVQAVQHDQVLCLICQEEVPGHTCYNTLVHPACASGRFHRCIQGQALCSGLHHFRCPLCRDMRTFQGEMFRLGVKIPDRQAWHRVRAGSSAPAANEEQGGGGLSTQPGAGTPQPGGLWWRLLLCSSCGSHGTHWRCSNMEDDTESWECANCRDTGTSEGCSWSDG